MKTADLLGQLPAPWPQNPQPGIRKRALAANRTIVVLDDDPTGTQTVYDVPVITTWATDHLLKAFANEEPLIYILTNSRSNPAEEARKINREVARAVKAASEATGRAFAVISRSDSTLRGHYPLETDTLASELELNEAPVVLAPFFEEGGRVTIDDRHYVVSGEDAIPAAKTPFARDAVFGFKHSHLGEWVEEKTGGRLAANEVYAINLESIRIGGPSDVTAILKALPPRSVCVVNAVEMRDMEVVAEAIHDAWDAGKTFLFRSAASIVRALVGLEKRALLSASEMVLETPHGGLIAVGSHVPMSTKQLECVLESNEVASVELPVKQVLAGEHVVDETSIEVDRYLGEGKNVVLFTSRELATASSDEENLRISQTVSEAMVKTIRKLTVTPRFLIAKGGITSSDIATKALEVAQATVLGQLLPGVPVWRLGEETRYPGLGYVVFPGNVGTNESLLEAVRRIRNHV